MMKKFTYHIVQKRIQNWDNFQSPAVRAEYGRLQGWASIWINFVLAAIKGGLGIVTGSLALVADAFHTLSDIMTSIVIVVSFHISGKPSDEEHPFGHGRLEAIATVIVAVLLMVVGIEIFKGGVERLIHPQTFDVSIGLIMLIALTVVVKELLSQFSKELSIMIGSSALEADFWHHRSDALSSVVVMIALAGQKAGFVYLDGVASLFVAAIILYTGWRILKDGIDELLGKRPCAEWSERIKETARSVRDVLDVHDLIVHQYGQSMIVSLHIQICESHSLKYAHEISEQVERKIEEEFSAHATVHLDPVNITDPEIIRIKKNLESLLKQHDTEITYHDLRILNNQKGKGLAFDIKVDPVMSEKEVAAYRKMLISSLQKSFRDVQFIQVQVEPKYVM